MGGSKCQRNWCLLATSFKHCDNDSKRKATLVISPARKPSWRVQNLQPSLLPSASVLNSLAKQFETVAKLINIYVYKALTDHLNSAHKQNMHESFEMALYWSYLGMNKNDNLRQRIIDQIQRILKDAPVNDHFLPLLWKGFAECQSKWVQNFFQETALSKRKVSSDNKITDIPSEVQRIVGWAIRAELMKRLK
jgi:hypothetical protein